MKDKYVVSVAKCVATHLIYGKPRICESCIPRRHTTVHKLRYNLPNNVANTWLSHATQILFIGIVLNC